MMLVMFFQYQVHLWNKQNILITVGLKFWKCFSFDFDRHRDVKTFTLWLLKCSGLALIVYQIAIYPSVEKATGPVSIARISSVSFHLILAIMSFQHFIFCYLKCVLLLWSHMQILSIPLLQSYPFIALLSGLALYIVLSIFTILKNVLSVSTPLQSFISDFEDWIY